MLVTNARYAALNYRRSIGDMRRNGSKKQKIKVPLSRRESALASGTISLERSRSKSAMGDKRGERKEGNCRFSPFI